MWSGFHTKIRKPNTSRLWLSLGRDQRWKVAVANGTHSCRLHHSRVGSVPREKPVSRGDEVAPTSAFNRLNMVVDQRSVSISVKEGLAPKCGRGCPRSKRVSR